MDTNTLMQLVDGEVEEIHVFDVSDCQLYGQKDRRTLPPELVKLAIEHGYETSTYQSVYWLTIAYIPAWPLGTYRILPHQEADEDTGMCYRAIRIADDDWQIACHRLVACLIVVATFLVIAALVSRS